MKRFLSFVFAASALISALGCAYSVRSLVYDKSAKLYVKPFENKVDLNIKGEYSDHYGYKIYRHGLETKVTDAVINRFLLDGYLKVVSVEEDADFVLNGELVSYEKQPLRYDETRNVQEYRANVIVNLYMNDAKKGKVLWRERGFVGYSEFSTVGSRAKTEDAAIGEAVDDLARRVVERTVEDW